MGDMIDEFNAKGKTLRDKLSHMKLTPDQKKMIKDAMDFGYAAAFCEKTSEINGSYHAGERFAKEYALLRDQVK